MDEEIIKQFVKECIEIGTTVRNQPIINGSDDYKIGREMGIEVFMNEIKKHFGV